METSAKQNGQRLPAEWQYQTEFTALAKHDKAAKPKGWRLSPQAVRTFILGSNGKKIGKNIIDRKIFGNDLVVERALVTLAGQRGLMLVGEPGTAKSMLSELLAGAIIRAQPDCLNTLNAARLVCLLPGFGQDLIRHSAEQILAAVSKSAAQVLRNALVEAFSRCEARLLQQLGWLDIKTKNVRQTCLEILLAHPDAAARVY